MIWTYPSRIAGRNPPGARHDGRPRALIRGRPECAKPYAELSPEAAFACSPGGACFFAARSPQRDRRDHENCPVGRIANPGGLRSRRCLPWRCRAGRAGVLCPGRSAQRLAVLDSGRNSIPAAPAPRLDRRRARAPDDPRRTERRRGDRRGHGEGREGRSSCAILQRCFRPI